MSDQLISSLQKRVDELTQENATLKSEAKDRRIANKKLKQQNETLTQDLGARTAERDALQSKVDAKPGELQAEVDRLQGELRSRDHRDAFAQVKEFKVKDEEGKEQSYTLNDGVTVAALWKHLDYKPEGETPDQAKINGLMGGAVKTAAYLFKPAADAATSEAGASKQPAPMTRREPGPGSGTRVLTASTDRPSVAALVHDDYAKSGRRIPGRL